MYPSLSVIFFTTASGAGYGLLALLCLLVPLGSLPRTPLFGFIALAIALGAITAGLLSSLLHLGQKKRAWRAFSQWRTSWLSREGVAAVATYVPAALFGIAWIFFGRIEPIAGLAAALLAVVTVVCTAMIYRSLKPIPRWHNPLVVPTYLALALMSGSLWLALLLAFFGPRPEVNVLAAASIVVGAGLKITYWRSIDTEQPTSTAGTATGLGSLGAVRLFEAPHTSENYLLKEMGFVVARKHATKLRRIALIVGFALPFLLSLVPFLFSSGVAILALLLAASLGTAGIFVERWLFFAEARHAVTLYYGASAV
ncbi:MAG: dimethyl sulfoxide reductase anchor subunit [Enhydrobacter sp.]|nr:dimethyl sulfoxide reductase anchor subunit [Enhydrobacter sp.]